MKGISELCAYKLSFELLEVVKFNKSDCIFNSGEVLEPVKYITLKRAESRKDKRGHLSKATRIEFGKQVIKGFYIIKSGKCEL